MSDVTTIGIDLAKNVFQVHGVDSRGQVVFRKQLRRKQMAAFFANLPLALIGRKARASAHYWARKLAWYPSSISSSGKQQLRGISKRGDSYLRTLLIHGARAVIRLAATKLEANPWLIRMLSRRPVNVTAFPSPGR